MKGSSFRVRRVERDSRHRDMEAWEGMGTVRGFPSSSEWVAPRGESQIINAQKTGEDWGWKNRVQTEEGLFCHAKELEFYLEGHSGPWGFVSKHVMLKGNTYCLFPPHSPEGKNRAATLSLPPGRKGKSREKGKCVWLEQLCYSPSRHNFNSTVVFLILLHKTQRWLWVFCGHQADTLAWGLEGGSKRQVVSAICIGYNSSGTARTRILLSVPSNSVVPTQQFHGVLKQLGSLAPPGMLWATQYPLINPCLPKLCHLQLRT